MLNYESDTTAKTAPTRGPQGNNAAYGYLAGAKELSDNSYAVVPLDNKNQISLSRDGAVL